MTEAGAIAQSATEGKRVQAAVSVEGLTKIYPKNLRAVDSVSFAVDEGEVFGLLGPNGAGKTTIIKSIMTLTTPDEGKITVRGVDARARPAAARQIMGYVPQEVSVDGDLTAYENLLIFAKFYGVPDSVRKERIAEVLGHMGLEKRAGDLVTTFSGGMMRRLEIAQALVNRPRVLFLDEPSIGLDPSARLEVWRHVKELNEELGTTILLTTHDMLEADRLCHRIAIMNAGRFVATGSPEELKRSVGREVVAVGLGGNCAGTGRVAGVSFPPGLGATVMESAGTSGGPEMNKEMAVVVSGKAEEAIPAIVKAFEDAGIEVASISMSKPTLDDVFLKYTATRIGDVETYKQTKAARRSFRKHAR